MRVQLIRYHDLDNMNTRLAQSLNKKQGVLPPLGLAYVASALEKAGHTVDLIDAIALCLSKEQVEQRIREFNPAIVGITAMTPTVRGALEAAELAKSCGAITVIGGVHMSILAKETLSYEFVDYGIVGEGEESFVEFCDAIENDRPYMDIVGLCYKTGGRTTVGLPRIITDVDSLTQPSYHLLPMSKYSSIIGLHPTSTMMGSRGCPYQCGFCFKTPSDKKYRSRNVQDIVNEIEHLVDTYGVKEIMFYDDIMPKDYARALSEEIIRRNVSIKWQTPERVNLVDPDLLMVRFFYELCPKTLILGPRGEITNGPTQIRFLTCAKWSTIWTYAMIFTGMRGPYRFGGGYQSRGHQSRKPFMMRVWMKDSN